MESSDHVDQDCTLILEDVSFRYPMGARNAFSQINLRIHRNIITAVIGPSESGKSTLLQFVSGIAHTYYPASLVTGSTTLLGTRYSDQAPPLHIGKILYVHQEPGIQLSGMSRTVEEEIALSATNLEKRQSFQDATELFGITHLLKRDPMTLSGGEQQRVALASAYVMETRILLLDEPALALDEKGFDTLVRTFHALRQKSILLYTSKRFDILSEMADHIIVFSSDGTCAASGPPAEILAKRDTLENDIIFDPS